MSTKSPNALTESGRASLDRATRILSDGVSIEPEILEEAAIPRGLVRIASTVAFGADQLVPLLPAFMQGHPEIEIDLCLTDHKVDVVGEAFDVPCVWGRWRIPP